MAILNRLVFILSLSAFLLHMNEGWAQGQGKRPGVQFETVREKQGPPIFFSTLTWQDGLPKGGVRQVFEDKHGYLWIAHAQAGLLRYDGTGFRSMRPDSTDLIKGFSGTPILDSLGRLWFASDLGMACYDYQSDKLVVHKLSLNGLTVYPRHMVPFGHGKALLLVGPIEAIGLTLYSFNLHTGTYNLFSPARSSQQNGFLFENSGLEVLSRDSNGHIWFFQRLNGRSGLVEFDPEMKMCSFYPYGVSQQEMRIRNLGASWTCMLSDNNGDWIWLSGWNSGLQGFHKPSRTWTIFGPYRTYYSMVNDAEGHLWLSSYEGGIFKRNKVNGNLFSYPPSGLAPATHSPMRGRLFQITPPNDSSITWIAGEQGISLIDPYLQNFNQKSYLPRTGECVALSSDSLTHSVFAFIERRLENGVVRNQIAKWDENSGKLTFRNFLTLKESLNTPMFFQRDRSGVLWAGPALQINEQTLRPTKENFSLINSAKQQIVPWRALPGTGNTMWLSNRWGGLFRMNIEKRQIEGVYIPGDGLAEGEAEFRNTLPAPKGSLWIATTRGLLLFHPERHEVRRFMNISNDLTSLPSDFVADIALDDKGRLWVLTARGLCFFSEKDSSFVTVSHTRYHFSRMAIDHSGGIWAKCEEGVFFYSPTTNRGRLFTERDGLFADLYERITTSPSGEIVLGNVHRWTPESIRLQSRPPKVVFKTFMVFNKVPFDLPSLNDGSEIVLKNTDNFFTIGFAALNLSQPWLNQYKWRLNGIDPHWVSGGNQHLVSYTHLPPGEYLFEVLAANNNGYWSEVPLRLRIRILPAWWQTLPFQLLMLLLFLGIGWAAFHEYAQKLQRKAAILQKEAAFARQQADFRQRIAETEMIALRAQMNPHFLFNVLMSIDRFLMENDPSQASVYLNKFSRLIRLVLENSRQKKISLGQELDALRLYLELEALRFKEKVRWKIEISPEVDLNFLQVPPMLFQPFVENAIWHGLLHKDEGGHVILRLNQAEENLLSVEIEDNGIGRERARALKSKSAVQQKSFGMQLTQERMELVYLLYPFDSAISVIDLIDSSGKAAGTKVILKIPI